MFSLGMTIGVAVRSPPIVVLLHCCVQKCEWGYNTTSRRERPRILRRAHQEASDGSVRRKTILRACCLAPPIKKQGIQEKAMHPEVSPFYLSQTTSQSLKPALHIIYALDI